MEHTPAKLLLQPNLTLISTLSVSLEFNSFTKHASSAQSRKCQARLRISSKNKQQWLKEVTDRKQEQKSPIQQKLSLQQETVLKMTVYHCPSHSAFPAVCGDNIVLKRPVLTATLERPRGPRELNTCTEHPLTTTESPAGG